MRQLFFDFEIPEKEEGENRLLYSAAFVVLIASLVLGHLITRNMLWKMFSEESSETFLSEQEKEKIYEVLVEQQFINPEKKDEYKALSDRDSAGGGGLTEKQGFHTLSPFREFIYGSASAQPSKAQPKSEQTKEDDLFEIGIFKADPVSKQTTEESTNQNASAGQMTKIPFNYRFQQDFLFRWDGAKALTIPTKQYAGYHYFKNMLRRIEESFAPPGGGNYAYRDMAGIVAREGIKPGVAKVQFLLSEGGQVLDVKLVGSQGQTVVDQSCMDSIRGQNFGPVPEEVKAKGLIFGINFIFPDIYR
ncbi:TonB-dependent receptor [Leptospira ryugenii]|uniref:TonB-dependent receptor n=1 Tax=Leptospira ryugenii TaxID=1917863 RepID=A0A2P2E040_9LEPT|nr:TonB-dependent receptor [Leptospira ryugenii]